MAEEYPRQILKTIADRANAAMAEKYVSMGSTMPTESRVGIGMVEAVLREYDLMQARKRKKAV